MTRSTEHTISVEKAASASDSTESQIGPALGEPAPLFETKIGETPISLKDFRKSWLILFTHAGDILPLLKTRTIQYILCKRRTKAVALGEASAAETGGGFLKKYILKHNLMIVDDCGGTIAECYGLHANSEGEEMKGVFIIDPRGILRVKLFSPVSAEQNFYDILKLRDALQAADTKKAQTRSPKTWKQRLRVTILPTPRESN